jgi:Peptidase family M23
MRAGCYLAVAAGALVCVTTGAAKTTVPKLLFPVVGAVDYHDDFGEPRGNLPHQGNDLIAAKRAPAVAVEDGTVEYWTTSASAGCMLYLYGDSGMMYEYIHLNNDLTARNDNKGTCVKGVAYTVRNHERVVAGQQIGYVGDSGDANGIHPHLHFEVHPNGGKAVDPYPFLQRASRLLAPAPANGALFSLRLSGTLVEASETQLTLSVDRVTAWPSHVTQTRFDHVVSLAMSGGPLTAPVAGGKIVAWTVPAPPTIAALTGAPAALTVDRIASG